MSKRRASWIAPSLALTTLFAAACGAGAPADEEKKTASTAEAPPPVDPATAAIITGRIVFEGTAPAAQAIDMSEEPTCAAKHPAGAKAEPVLVNANGTLKNVFVYVKQGLEDRKFPAPEQAVVLNQDGCVYHPHVLGLEVGQTLTLKNSDGLLHNINAKPTRNRGFNVSQPTTMESARSFSAPEVMIPIACDVHGWMQAYIGVLDHPYFAVSGGDGTFSLAQLPPGDYLLEAWHERYGTQTLNVTVGAQETKQIEFRFSASMAEGAVVPLGRPIDLHDHGAGHATGGVAASDGR